MNETKEFILNIINEAVKSIATQDDIIDAIKKRYEVKITYESDNDPKGNGERLIQPVAYGKSSSGNYVVRAFQPMGDTKSKVPSWKLFRIDRITSYEPLKRNHFSEPPSNGFITNGYFNPNGDKSMSEVYVVADFSGAKARYERGGLKKYNTDVRQKKIEQDPLYVMKKNMSKKGINTPDYVLKNVQNWKRNSDMDKYLNGASAEEMEKTNDFGNNNIQTTTGPVIKGQSEVDNTKQDNTTKQEIDYNKIKQNGPVFKGNQDKTELSDTELEDNKEKTEEV